MANVTEDATIQFSYIGYQTTEVKANSKELARIILKEDSELLDEVIVVGYGVQKRSDVTGAISSVTSEKLNSSIFGYVCQRIVSVNIGNDTVCRTFY